ncbi:IS982 family transposase [Anabaena cylindrica UHCC 0172]|nr:IS982 family transposase [Anabaena cylindrica]MEA5551947.1 IS982 family transposase [Anabaena cylindrica UHCC 0172]
MELETIFCEIDDFCNYFEPIFQAQLIPSQIKKRIRPSQFCLSEIMTIIVYFHRSSYRNFKDYYVKHICKYCQGDFPKLVSYQRFIELMPNSLIPLMYYLNTRKGLNTGISFIDSTSIPICHSKRAKTNKVFKNLAGCGKSSICWYFGFKLHLIINDQGELLAFQITPGNIDDRKPVPTLTKKIFGKIFGDKGYISQKLWLELWSNGLKLITPFKKNMRNKLLSLEEKLMLRKRSLIETVNDQLKNISQLVHSRHRSVTNFMVKARLCRNGSFVR